MLDLDRAGRARRPGPVETGRSADSPAIATAAGSWPSRRASDRPGIGVVKHFPGIGDRTGNSDVGPCRRPAVDVVAEAGTAPFPPRPGRSAGGHGVQLTVPV